jgi:hypothetical protein
MIDRTSCIAAIPFQYSHHIASVDRSSFDYYDSLIKTRNPGEALITIDRSMHQMEDHARPIEFRYECRKPETLVIVINLLMDRIESIDLSMDRIESMWIGSNRIDRSVNGSDQIESIDLSMDRIGSDRIDRSVNGLDQIETINQ